ncbi:MAG: hypothetical protein JXK07_11920 [Spirochaetes bacterium]|nr:hypothetical protein [Spirochaetota bacterium]MBN2769407.1 hypothetical protein [Spirochaetota bacterium]
MKIFYCVSNCFIVKFCKIGLFCTVLTMFSQNTFANAFIDAEYAMVFTGYNDVQVPSDDGTRFSLKDDIASDSGFAPRMRIGYTFLQRHSLLLLAAPLTIYGEGVIDKDIDYRGKTFEAGTEVKSTYRFDSYRITYRYIFVNSNQFSVAAGITGKIRDAEIRLTGENGSAGKSNIGFVPLIHLMAQWKFTDKYSMLLDMDALASPYGRAEDALFALQYHYNEKTSFRLGYRILEGGSDGGGDVYTFALFNYITVGLTTEL